MIPVCAWPLFGERDREVESCSFTNTWPFLRPATFSLSTFHELYGALLESTAFATVQLQFLLQDFCYTPGEISSETADVVNSSELPRSGENFENGGSQVMISYCWNAFGALKSQKFSRLRRCIFLIEIILRFFNTGRQSILINPPSRVSFAQLCRRLVI